MMVELFTMPLFWSGLTLLAYTASLVLYHKSRHFTLMHPLIIASVPLAVLLEYSDQDYARYAESTTWLSWLLGPAVVALAVPLQQHWHHIRPMLRSILFVMIIASLFATLSAVALGYILGFDELVLKSLAPKTVTSPIAMDIVEVTGGYITLAAGIVIIVGVVGALSAPLIFKWFGIDDMRIRGFTLGLTSHGVGTAKAFEEGPLCGAFASLALGLTGLFVASVLPLVVLWWFS